MPTAATPAYIGHDFQSASPALRFGMLLPVWTTRQDQEQEVNKRADAKSREADEVRDLLRRGMDHAIAQLCTGQRRPLPSRWAKNDFASRNAWKSMCALSKLDIERMKAWIARQSAGALLHADRGALITLDALATAPFTTGLGNEHPLENGFAFLNPYGLPYLPGSGVKGVLRQAARELASGEWGATKGWTEDAITHLFGLESDDGGQAQQRGALMFWDVMPQLKGESLQVEVMTPHQSHYYQKSDEPAGGSASPHDSGRPIPINFLTVPPGSRFTFHVQCDAPFLRGHAPALVEGDRWKVLLQVAFAHAFEWLGFGAKTAVGYGAMQVDLDAERNRAAKALKRQEDESRRFEEAERQRAIASMSPADRAMAEAYDKRIHKDQDERSVLFNALKKGELPDYRREVAQRLKMLMQEKGRWREKSEKKNPEKDEPHKETLQVKKWLES